MSSFNYMAVRYILPIQSFNQNKDIGGNLSNYLRQFSDVQKVQICTKN